MKTFLINLWLIFEGKLVEIERKMNFSLNKICWPLLLRSLTFSPIQFLYIQKKLKQGVISGTFWKKLDCRLKMLQLSSFWVKFLHFLDFRLRQNCLKVLKICQKRSKIKKIMPIGALKGLFNREFKFKEEVKWFSCPQN